MLCRKAMSCFSDSTCDSSTKLQNTGILYKADWHNIICPYCDNSFGPYDTTIHVLALLLFLLGKTNMIDDPLFNYHSPHFEKYTMQDFFSATSLRIPIVSLWIAPYMFLVVFFLDKSMRMLYTCDKISCLYFVQRQLML